MGARWERELGEMGIQVTRKIDSLHMELLASYGGNDERD